MSPFSVFLNGRTTLVYRPLLCVDVNVGVPGIDEAALMPELIKKLQAVTNLPLQIDSSNADAIEAALRVYNGKPIDITLPTFITRTVVETEPGARGDTASSNVMKPAKLDNGYELMVPLFINQGDTIKVDTRTGGYAERVSKG